MRDENFEGELIPFGAEVYFKPSEVRNVDQDHKMNPDAIPNVFGRV